MKTSFRPKTKVFVEPEEENLINYFDSINIIWTRVDTETSKQHVSIAALLPSGLLKNDYELSEIDEGVVLQVKVKWPAFVTDAIGLHQVWIKLNDSLGIFSLMEYHPRVHNYKNELRSYRYKEQVVIWFIATFSLPFKVQTKDVEDQVLGSKNPSIVLYITMTSFDVDFYATNDKKRKVTWLEYNFSYMILYYFIVSGVKLVLLFVSILVR